MLTKKNIKKSIDGLKEINDAIKDNLDLSNGITEDDFKKPFVAVEKNGEIIAKTLNPLSNSVYIGKDKLKFSWDYQLNHEFSIELDQHVGDNINFIFSLDGNLIQCFQSRAGETDLKPKLELKIEL